MDAAPLDISLVDQVTAALKDEVSAFWQQQGVTLPEAEAQRRLSALAAVARDDKGHIKAVATAPVHRLEALNNTPFYVWRMLVDASFRGTATGQQLFAAFYRRKNQQGWTPGAPAGIFTGMADEQLEGPGVPARTAIDGIPSYLVGHSSEHYRQRVSYFDDARISDESSGSIHDPMRALPDGYVMRVTHQGVTGDDAQACKALWQAESNLQAHEFEDRLREVYVTTWAPDGSLCGIMTSYVAPVPGIGNMHWTRALVAAAHRQNNIPALMCARLLEDLQQRVDAGEAQDSLGMFYEVQSPSIRVYRNDAVWPATDAAYIGQSPEGFHWRASYLRGVSAQPAGALIPRSDH